MFSNGLGFQANYTYVKSSLTYDNMGLGNQFALVGLSNSANLVGIYEDQKWSIRLAYNCPATCWAHATSSDRVMGRRSRAVVLTGRPAGRPFFACRRGSV